MLLMLCKKQIQTNNITHSKVCGTKSVFNYLLAILLFVLALLPSKSYAVFFKQMGVPEGLAQLSVLSVEQDILGRIWFGTYEGLSVYDGRQLRTYKPVEATDMDGNVVNVGVNIGCIESDDKTGDVFLISRDALVKFDIHKRKFLLKEKSGVRDLYFHNNVMWCIKNNSLYRYDDNADSLVFHRDLGKNISRSLLVAGNTLFVGKTDGLYLTSLGDSPMECVIGGGYVKDMYADSFNRVWIATADKGCYMAEKTDGRWSVRKITLTTPSGTEVNDIRAFTVDSYDNIWIGTFNGLFCFSGNLEKSSYFVSNNVRGGLSHSSIYSLFSDKQGTLWIGTYYGGVNYLTGKGRELKYYPYNSDRDDCLHFPIVGDITEDNDGDIWLCLDGGGLARLNPETSAIRHYSYSVNGTEKNNFRAICYDSIGGNMFLGIHKGGFVRFDIRKEKFYGYRTGDGDVSDAYSRRKEISHSEIVDDIAMYNDSVLVAARNGLFILDKFSGKGRMICNKVILHFDIDSDGVLWGINTKRVIKVDLKNGVASELDSFRSSSEFSDLVCYRDKIYVSTYGGGIYELHNKGNVLRNIRKSSSRLVSNYCYNMLVTPDEFLVVTTDNGVNLYNLKYDMFYSVDIDNTFSIPQICYQSGVFRSSDKRYYVGGALGMVSFDGSMFSQSMRMPDVYFSSLYIGNRRIRPDDGSGILDDALPFQKRISLKHNENNIRVNFASVGVSDLVNKGVFEYCLEGMDNDWIRVDNNEISYTNLPPGHYKLKLRNRVDVPGRDDRSVTSLLIDIAHPWYATWWMRSIFCVAVVLFVYWYYNMKRARMILNQTIERERMEKKHQEELNLAKFRFFTNISHELRTPLTLISGQVDLLQLNSALPVPVRNNILSIGKQARHLTELVTELLDFRKLDQHKEKLHISRLNLVPFLMDVFESFRLVAEGRQMAYSFECGQDEVMVWADIRQFQKVVFNLLSNSFKYTPDGGSVALSLSVDGDKAVIRVSDTGEGIPASHLPYVFERFFRSQPDNRADDATGSAKVGTGIGLALAKTIVDLHHGDITVKSDVGKGTEFTVTLPTDKQIFQSDDMVEWAEESKESAPGVISDTIPSVTDVENTVSEFRSMFNDDRKKVLVVEDNDELRDVLVQLLSPVFDVSVASDGAEGLEKANSINPDLVLSDVMMPNMSGTEMCDRIKSSLELCHIPVILLTALDSPANSIEGLKSGADDYVTKPFNASVLLARCTAIIKNRNILLRKYQSSVQEPEVTVLATNPLDKKFLDDVLNVINENIDNPDLDIPFICREIGVSRSLMQRKFRALTDSTPNEFIVRHKLNMACKALRENPFAQISEISDNFGFGSPRYFARLFKEQFGVTPGDFRKQCVSGSKVAESNGSENYSSINNGSNNNSLEDNGSEKNI